MLDSGNDYVVTVKENQPTLYQSLQTTETYLKPVSEHQQTNRGRGRQEHRLLKVYRPEMVDSDLWVGVKSVLCIERWGERQGKPYHHKAYAISSVATSAAQWQPIIREHWRIENQLHWPKDVVLGEDDYRLKSPEAMLNWSVFKTIVINLLRINGFQSVKGALTKLANRVDKIFLLLQ